jgi:hypothetical protein
MRYFPTMPDAFVEAQCAAVRTGLRMRVRRQSDGWWFISTAGVVPTPITRRV